MLARVSVAVLCAALVAGCQTPTKEQTGAVLGGVAGGVLGNQIGDGRGRTAAVIGGTLVGALIGGSIGREMDENDRYRAQQALEYTPTRQSSTWTNPDSGNRYSVTPVRTYESAQGPCREYETEAYIDGRREVVVGNACRQSDGTWRSVN
jgi:surface antigen